MIEGNVELSSMQMDALNEMGNVGTGNAATALSKLIGKSVDMNIPETKFVSIKDFANEFGGPEAVVSAIYLEIDDGLKGEVMFVFPQEGAFEMADLLQMKEPGTTKELDEMDQSAFKELANILIGAFLTSLSKMLDVSIIPSTPHMTTDMVQSVVDFILIRISQHAEQALCVKTKINVEGQNINGDFIVLFDKDSLNLMVEVLNKQFGGL